MGSLLVESTGAPARGEHLLGGGKHAFAHALAAAALAREGQLTRVPNIVDSDALIEALQLVFTQVEHDTERHTLRFAGPRPDPVVVLQQNLIARSRNLFCLLPALLHHAQRVVLDGDPMGCSIGERPYGWYLDTLARFGVEVSEDGAAVVLAWRARRPAQLVFDYPTMTGTVVAVAAAAVTPGASRIRGASVEPSCDDQLACLRSMGASLDGSLPELRIEGATQLEPARFELPIDRVHAVTIATAALLSRGEVTLRSNSPLRMPRFVAFLREIGAAAEEGPQHLFVRFPHERRELGCVSLEAGSEPLFSSDWVTFAALLLATRSRGTSELSDNVFLKRFQFTEALPGRASLAISTTAGRRAGRAAVIARIDGARDVVLPGGEPSPCPDIRGTAALALSALVSSSPVRIADDFQLRRGYENLGADLEGLGVAKVTRTT